MRCTRCAWLVSVPQGPACSAGTRGDCACTPCAWALSSNQKRTGCSAVPQAGLSSWRRRPGLIKPGCSEEPLSTPCSTGNSSLTWAAAGAQALKIWTFQQHCQSTHELHTGTTQLQLSAWPLPKVTLCLPARRGQEQLTLLGNQNRTMCRGPVPDVRGPVLRHSCHQGAARGVTGSRVLLEPGTAVAGRAMAPP